jgi:tetratricopeptide (TPR) repeat protein
MGSTGAFKLFWDDALVLQDSAYRQLDIDRFATTVTLSPGPHRITVKVCGTDESPKFALRLGDARGAPELGVELSTDPAKSDEVARAISARKAEKTDKTAAKSELAGPLQRLSARAEAKDAKPADLEAYARYLAATGGDPDSEHTARDLARRAAEGEPTVARLLFAGSLAEDRNQRAEWLEKARALATEERVDVLLAEARHARSGTNWRDAVPIYRRILALEPDNVDGTLGLVELYGEAGLRRTALATIERAVERRPTTIALLRTFAGELRAAGRDTEAVEVEARYVGLRFDDTGYLAEQVDLAVARRDSDGARRWLTRLQQTDPDSTWSRGVAARTYRALGEPARAIATYQDALQMAPEDLGSLRALSDLFGERGERAEQLALLRKILSLSPQAKDVRDYVDFIEPKEPRADERYAWAPERFLPLRAQPSPGYPRRTLRQLTVSTVYPNGLSSKFRQIVYQPLTDEGAASAREYAFTYEADRQLVELRAAKVYRKSGRVDEAIESGEGPADNPAIAMYTSQRTVYVHFPRLEPGDIVELRYRIEDVAARNEVGDYFGELEYMQSGEPVAGAEYVVVAPKSRTLYTSVTHLPGAKTETREDGDKRIFRVTADSIAPVAAEPWMPPWAEVLGRVHVSTFASWQEVGAYYWGLSRDQLDVDDELRAKIRELTKDKATPREKVEAVYAYVTRLRYVALELGIEGIRPAARGADHRAWLGRLQRQGDGDRHHAARARHPRDGGPRAHGPARAERRPTGEPGALRSRHRVRALPRPLPRWHRRTHGHARAADVRSRRVRFAGERRQTAARSAAPPARRRERQRAQGGGHPRGGRLRAGRGGADHLGRARRRVARSLHRRRHAARARDAGSRERFRQRRSRPRKARARAGRSRRRRTTRTLQGARQGDHVRAQRGGLALGAHRPRFQPGRRAHAPRQTCAGPGDPRPLGARRRLVAQRSSGHEGRRRARAAEARHTLRQLLDQRGAQRQPRHREEPPRLREDPHPARGIRGIPGLLSGGGSGLRAARRVRQVAPRGSHLPNVDRSRTLRRHGPTAPSFSSRVAPRPARSLRRAARL